MNLKEVYKWLREKGANVTFVGKDVIMGEFKGFPFFYMNNELHISDLRGRLAVIPTIEAAERWYEANHVIKTSLNWRIYNKDNKNTFPVDAHKYWVIRKNGNMEQCMWNGTSWAYNNNDIVYYSYYDPKRYLKI